MGGVEVFVGEFEVMGMGERGLVTGLRVLMRWDDASKYCLDGKRGNL